MKLIKISQQYQTKDGRSITFEELPFNETTDKRGWVFHRINAYVDGEVAGHITLSYIPRDRWESIYQGNIWKFKDLSLGGAHMPNELIDSGDGKAIAKYIDENYSYINGENWVITFQVQALLI